MLHLPKRLQYTYLEGVHAHAFDAPMMEAQDHLWIQLAMERKKDPSQVYVNVDDVLAISKGFGEEPKGRIWVSVQSICCGWRLGDKKKNAILFFYRGCK